MHQNRRLSLLKEFVCDAHSGYGKDAKSAIKSLNEQKETVRKELVGMNAQAESIRFSTTDISSGMSGGMNARMFRSMQMGGPGGGDDEATEDAMPKYREQAVGLRPSGHCR